MAMVMLLVGILASLGMSFINAKMSQTSYTVTKQRMQMIKDTMISYLRVNGKLPCPDWIVSGDFTGKEVSSSGTCSNSSYGIVPYVTLGLAREQIIDGWGNFFSYRIDTTIQPGKTTPFWTSVGTYVNNDKNESSIGSLTIKSTTTSSSNTASNVVVVLLSHGPNSAGAYSLKATRNTLPDATNNPDESTNTTFSSTFYIDRPFSDNSAATGGAFDDIIGYMTVADLVGPLIGEGTVKSSLANRTTLDTQVSRIKNALFYFASVDQATVDRNCSTATGYLVWSANTAMSQDQKVVPTTPNGYYYTATPNGNGKTDPSTEPTWPTVVGSQVTDNNVIWTCAQHYRHRLPAGATYSPAAGTENGLYDAGGGLPYSVLTALTSTDITDPWGHNIYYSVNANVASAVQTSNNSGLYFGAAGTSGIAYRLISLGPNGTLDTVTTGGWLSANCSSDDICYNVTIGDLVSTIANAGVKMDSSACP
ncbi:MAG: hypothetical protein HQL74_15435 [Magnetococcales bacterium]|nr:hypothetical protein [Magnetococcales bacterium]